MSARPTRLLVPSGVLGLGFDRAALARGVAAAPDLIAIDGGSTDSGPYYLGTGTSKYARSVTDGEWRELLDARERAGCPLVIGSAGTSGVDAEVDALVATTERWARERGRALEVATLRTELDAATVLAALAEGRLMPLDPAAATPPPTMPPDEQAALAERVRDCSHIVALAGREAIAAALATGADVVIAGRATDTALFAALPIARGADPGAAWHAAKTIECGALCSTAPDTGVVMAEVDGTGFGVRPLADGARCTPYTVSAHMLYENADPLVLHEPGGRLEVAAARYRALDETTVRVSGSRWIDETAYTLKLEGARLVGHQCSSLVLVRDPRYVRAIERWCETLSARLAETIRQRLGEVDHAIELRRIGRDATLGALEFARAEPVEIGVLLLVTAASAELALEICRLANPLLLHHGLPGDSAMPSFAFPYTPPETPRGPLYGFCLNHRMRVARWDEGCRLDTLRVGAS